MFIYVHKPLSIWQELFGGDVVHTEGIAIDMDAVDQVEPHHGGSKIFFSSGRTLVVSQTVQEVMELAYPDRSAFGTVASLR